MSRTITKTITVYRFDELEGTAKERARDWVMEGWERQEYMGTLRAMADHFGATLDDWSIDWTGGVYSSVDFWTERMVHEPEEIKALIDRLGSVNPKTGKGMGDCVLTGWHADEDAADGIREAWNRGKREPDELLQAGFRALLQSAEDNYRYDCSDEAITETCEANDYEFDRHGEPI